MSVENSLIDATKPQIANAKDIEKKGEKLPKNSM